MLPNRLLGDPATRQARLLTRPSALAFLARYSFSVSIRSQFCCNFSSPAAHVGEHSAGTSGPAGGSPVLGRYSADGVSQRCAQPLTISMHPSNSSGRISQFLFTLGRCGRPGGGIAVFALTHRLVVCPLRPLPVCGHLGAPVLQPPAIQPERCEYDDGRRQQVQPVPAQ